MKISNIKKSNLYNLFILTFALLALPVQSSLADNVGVWNGFLNQVNIIELNNPENKTITVNLEVFNNNSKSLYSKEYTLDSLETKHITLPSSDIQNAYGTYKISSADTDLEIPAISSIYKYSSSDESLEYVYAVEATIGKPGINSASFGTFNSINPESISGNVFNYLSIVNTENANFSAVVIFYDQEGKRIGDNINISLTAYGRTDIDITNIAGNKVGTYHIRTAINSSRIRPDDYVSPRYEANLYRFAVRENGTYNFAFPIQSQNKACNLNGIPVSTMNSARNWLEINNTSILNETFTLEIFDQTGELKHKTVYQLNGLTTKHVFVNEFLGESNSGFANLSCNKNYSFLTANSFFYGNNPSSVSPHAVDWAYVSQSTVNEYSPDTANLFFVNRNKDAANWLKNYSISEDGNFEIHTFATSGNKNSKYDYNLAANNGIDISFHNQSIAGFSDNQFGLAVGVNSSSSISQPELLRVFSNEAGEISVIMNVPRIEVERRAYTSVRALSEISTSTDFIVCAYIESDSDGDGWGWENNQSCRITEQSASQNQE